MYTYCSNCETANQDTAWRCAGCGLALVPLEGDGRAKSSFGRWVAGFVIGAVIAGVVGVGFPMFTLIIAGGLIGLLVVERRQKSRTDAAIEFLRRAAAREVLDEAMAQRLIIHRRWESGSAPSAVAGPTPPVPQADTIQWEPAGEPIPPQPARHEAPPVLPPVPEPAASEPVLPPVASAGTGHRKPRPGVDWSALLVRFWEPIRSDLAVHGLAYLGVLFVFVGVVGFVVFAFAGVGSTLRPIAEITIPAALFGSSWFLHKTGAPFVARSLELLGGLLTPVVLFAAFADGAAFPPDLEDRALVVTLTIISLALAGLYAWQARRRPDSSLRYLVAPLLWTAAGVVGLAFEKEPSAAQFASVAVAVAATTALARRMGDHALSRPALSVATGGSAGAFAIVLVFAAGAGWPPVPVTVAAAAFLLVVDVRRATLPLPWAWQLAGLVVAAAATAQTWNSSVVAAVTAVGSLAVIEWWARRDELDQLPIAGLAVFAVATGAAAAEPSWLLAAAGVGAVWFHTRRLSPLTERLAPLFDWGAVLAPLVAVGALRDWAGADVAWPLAAGLVAAAAVAVRRFRFSDSYLVLWHTIAAAALIFGSAFDGAGHPAALVTAVAGAGAFTAMAKGPGLGVWATSAALAWAGIQAIWALESDGRWAPVLLAVAGSVAVAWSISSRSTRAGHLGLVGLALGSVALAWRTGEWWLVVVLGALTVSVIMILVASLGARKSPSIIELLARAFAAGRLWVEAGFVLAAASLTPMWLVSILDAVDVDSGRLEWAGVVAGSWALVVAAGTRRFESPIRLVQVLAGSAFAWSVIGASAAAGSRFPEIVSLGLLVTTVVFIAPGQRYRLYIWSAWAALGLLAVSVGRHVGIGGSDLHRVPLVWGAVIAVGGLAWWRLHAGSRADGARLDVVPPVVLGTVAWLAGVVIELARPAEVMWAWIIGAALATGLAAVLASVGAVSAVSWALLTVGGWAGMSTQGWLSSERVWPTALWAAGLLLAATRLPGSGREDPWWKRWDLPPFVVAHLAGVVGSAAAIGSDMPATWALLGAVSVAVSLVLRRWPWAIGAALLLIGASLAAGDGWPTLTLLGISMVSVALSLVQPEPIRGRLHTVAAALALWGWGAAVAWRGWWPDPALAATAVGSGLLAVVIAVALRERWVGWRTAAPWAAAALVAELAVVATVAVGERGPAGVGLATGLALWALVLGVVARPLGLPWLREAAVVPAAGSGLALIYSQQPAAGKVALVVAGVGLLLGILGLWLTMSRESVWGRPVLIGSAAADVIAGVAALSVLPEIGALVVVLVAVGVKLLGTSVTMQSPVAGAGAVWSLTGAWLLFAGEAVAGNPQWFVVPVGVGLAASSDLVRWQLRRRQLSGPGLLPVDAVAALLIVGPSLTQTVTRSVAYAVVVMMLGSLIAGWGIATRIKRRLAIGAAAVAAGAGMLLIVPLARIIPQFRGPALWVTVIVLGMALIGVAVAIERGRSKLRLTIGRLRDLTADWEF